MTDMSNVPTTVTATDDEFFVGYLPNAPAGIARRVRAGVIVTLLVAAAAALAIALSFRQPASAVWRDRTDEFIGEVVERPYPALRVVAGVNTNRFLLVSTGKHGAADRVRGLDGRMVRIKGTSLERDAHRIIEIADGAGAVTEAAAGAVRPPAAATQPLARSTIEGEIIDPKCFFGAMKPGEGKLHKGCAIRCIDGGIPPMLAERNTTGDITYYLLVVGREPGTADGSVEGLGAPANRRVLPFVAEPVAVTGQVVTVDGMRVLRLDDTPEAIVRR